MLILENIRKDYLNGNNKPVRALDLPYWRVSRGDQIAIVGPSGSGKSTLLHCIAGLITPTEGTIAYDETYQHTMSESEITAWRGKEVGYIFQNLNLMAALTIEENIKAGLYFSHNSATSLSAQDISELLDKVGLKGYEKKLPHQLSMGEQQRVAFVRAICKQPSLILADEPTASLDEENSIRVIDLLQEYCRTHECTCLIATHDKSVQDRFPQRLTLMRGGRS